MDSNAWLPTDGSASPYLGDYDDTSPYPNPIMANDGATLTSLDVADQTSVNTLKNPDDYQPGDIGDMVYYPFQEGPFKETQTHVTSFTRLWQAYEAFQAIYDDYEDDLDDYNDDKDDYDEAVEEYNELI